MGHKHRSGHVLGVIAALLVVSGGLRLAFGVGPAIAYAEDTQPEMQEEEEATSVAVAPLLAALSEREERVALRETAIDDRLRALSLAEAELTERLAEVEAAEASLTAALSSSQAETRMPLRSEVADETLTTPVRRPIKQEKRQFL